MALMALAGNINVEEQEMVESSDDYDDDEDSENTEDWVDERECYARTSHITLALMLVRSIRRSIPFWRGWLEVEAS